ncbi:MAG: hypothetical protein COW13_04775 [Candidatus Omnitrophica bacterium CG12_big_fil_rev_8_21_14_0_65_50_5]|nr:MAG: hypothetical protein COW13_04775 [Candidatus Omnitrophica bacterium CG12_big_fil_rev_8_21_14_0_65_50_5]
MKKKVVLDLVVIIAVAFGMQFSAEAHNIKVPPFHGTDAYGIEHDMSDYAGKTKVLYFWATWCPACRRETKAINNLQPLLREKGVEFISVSLDKDVAALQAYIEQNKIEYPVLFDGKGWENEMAQLYGVNGTPSFLVIDKNDELVTQGSWNKQLESYVIANE